MKIHEYQARELFGEYGIPRPDGIVTESVAETVQAAGRLGFPAVIKAQVLVGGRGKAGGVKLVGDEAEARAAAEAILGMDIKGETVKKLLTVPAAGILQEYYLGLTLDRGRKSLTLMLSAAGGVDIEELAVNEPDKIIKEPIYPHKGLDRDRIRRLTDEVFGSPSLGAQAADTVEKVYRLFLDKGCSLVEINPYARIDETTMAALDAKVNIDDNAAETKADLAALRNDEEYSVDEIEAREAGLSFVSMEGEIGCIVNGAGLAMATMDIIKFYGGEPANFLDVGGSSSPQKVVTALTILMRNPKVKAILINIFGGITRCDDIANGILEARRQIDISIPMVIRLIGTNDREGRAILTSAGLEAEEGLSTAVRKVVALNGGAA
jgi:succinyl-CoA synthetase beta subunit